MVEQGILSRTAKLLVATWDIDQEFTWPGLDDHGQQWPVMDFIPPEQAYVYVNDPTLAKGQVFGELRGENNRFSVTEFEVPIEWLKFPERGTNGDPPAAAVNSLTIDPGVSIGNYGWCLEVQWVALSFQTVSPIILVHGNNSDPGFFDRHGFSVELFSNRWPFDGCADTWLGCQNPIQLTTGPIADNGEKLAEEIPKLARSFGVNSVHLIAHSKGGLDAREYLATSQPQFDNEFHVLSCTSLSTPHNGTVAADIKTTLNGASAKAQVLTFSGFPTFTSLLANRITYNLGLDWITTSATNIFNSGNVPILKTINTKYFQLVAADADHNASASIDQLSEWEAMKLDDEDLAALPSPAARWVVDILYRILRTTSEVKVTTTYSGPNPASVPILVLVGQNPSEPLLNDTLVTIRSARGTGSVANLNLSPGTFVVPLEFTASLGRNHSSIADEDVATRVREQLLRSEVLDKRGDLR